MTSVFDADGRNIPCTVIEAGPNIVTQVKNEESDGYYALQLGFDEKKTKNTSQQLTEHFKKAGTTPKHLVREFRDFQIDKQLGDEIRVDEVFQVGDTVGAVGISKGKGFQGVVKRHGFGGVGDATHGQHNRLRAPGSIGAGSTPSRVYKGMRMAGRTGGNRVKIRNLRVVRILPEKNLLLVKGAVPGYNGSYVIIEK